MLGADDMKAARHAFASGREAGHGVSALSEARWLFVPLPGERDPVGVIGARLFDDPIRLGPEQRRLMDIIADMAGLALDRTRLSRAAGEARAEAQAERAKSATREVRAKCEPTDVADVIEAAIEGVRYAPMPHVGRDIETGLPPAHIDRALTETVITSLLENAGKHAPLSSTIIVRARKQGDAIAIEVIDEGPGFPEQILPRVFEEGVGEAGGDGPPGPGLGLAVAKGFIVAQGGTIEVFNRRDRPGACLRLVLPIRR
jgi:two-component system sensor histidine kinase KdpD